MPSEAWREWQRLPAGFMEQVIEYRAYGSAKAVADANPKAAGGLVDLVRVIEFELVQEEIANG